VPRLDVDPDGVVGRLRGRWCLHQMMFEGAGTSVNFSADDASTFARDLASVS
jgi:hypothetical protein